MFLSSVCSKVSTLWFEAVTATNCLFGHHQWLREISVLDWRDDERVCCHCSARQIMVGGEWRDIN
jgi:hypothetical protein